MYRERGVAWRGTAWHGMAWGGHRVGKLCPKPRRAYRACNSAGTPASRQAGPLTAKQPLLGQSKLWPSPPRPPSTGSAAPVSRFGHPLFGLLLPKPFAAPIGPLPLRHCHRGIDHTSLNTSPAATGSRRPIYRVFFRLFPLHLFQAARGAHRASSTAGPLP